MPPLIRSIRIVPASVVAACLAIMATSLAQAEPAQPGEVTVLDQPALIERLRAMGYHRRGEIFRPQAESVDATGPTFPQFSGSYSARGRTYKYTMLGYAPDTGKTAELQVVIIPLRMHFRGFGKGHNLTVNFDPMLAVQNIVDSPIFKSATFPNGVGQFGDMLQRATFWNSMDAAHQWHVKLEVPVVLDAVDVNVDRSLGTLTRTDNVYTGNASGGFMQGEMETIMQTLHLQPDQLAIFVTGNVSADALGWHDIYAQTVSSGTAHLNTLIYTSWFDSKLVGPLLADISTLNHEIGEWLNDPYVNNPAPAWKYPPPSDSRSICADNPYLEVGDPEGDGPTYSDFPTIVIPLHGYSYHLQDLVMLPWFADQRPSSAQNGWYDFPGAHQITAPAVYCK